jgi:ankyrin repeat protein
MPTGTFSNDQLREFVIAGHWNLPKVQELLAQYPDLLNARYQWGENDYEPAIQAAAHAGAPAVAEFLLAQGAPLEICTAAMLGRQDEVQRLLDETPALIDAHGAHGIPLLAHAALSGSADLAKMIFERGAHKGASFALSNAVSKGHVDMARWLLENANPDPNWKNYEGKPALTIATEAGDQAMLALLTGHRAG